MVINEIMIVKLPCRIIEYWHRTRQQLTTSARHRHTLDRQLVHTRGDSYMTKQLTTSAWHRQTLIRELVLTWWDYHMMKELTMSAPHGQTLNGERIVTRGNYMYYETTDNVGMAWSDSQWGTSSHLRRLLIIWRNNWQCQHGTVTHSAGN